MEGYDEDSYDYDENTHDYVDTDYRVEEETDNFTSYPDYRWFEEPKSDDLVPDKENTHDYVDEDVEDLSRYDYPTHVETESEKLVRDIKERDEQEVEFDPELYDSNRERAKRERHRATIINFKKFGKVCSICGDYIDGETCNKFSKHSAIRRMKERFGSD